MEWIWERQFRSRQGREEMKDELVCVFSDGNWFPWGATQRWSKRVGLVSDPGKA